MEIKEIWLPIVGYEGKYEVSNLGRIKSVFRKRRSKKGVLCNVKERILILNYTRFGYLRCGLSDIRVKHFNVHRLVAEAFIPNPENKPQVNHINAIKDDNRLCNLEWATAKENSEHYISMGLRKECYGEDIKSAKLKEFEVVEIKHRLASRENQQTIADEYKVNRITINDIKNGRTWKRVVI